LKRLDSQARQLEAKAEGRSLETFIAVERAASPALDGRSVFGWESDLAGKRLRGPSCGRGARAGRLDCHHPPRPNARSEASGGGGLLHFRVLHGG